MSHGDEEMRIFPDDIGDFDISVSVADPSQLDHLLRLFPFERLIYRSLNASDLEFPVNGVKILTEYSGSLVFLPSPKTFLSIPLTTDDRPSRALGRSNPSLSTLSYQKLVICEGLRLYGTDRIPSRHTALDSFIS